MPTANIQSDGYLWAPAGTTNYTWADVSGNAVDATSGLPNMIMIGHYFGYESIASFTIGPIAIGQGETVTQADLTLGINQVYKDSRFQIFAILDPVTFGTPGDGNHFDTATQTTGTSIISAAALDATNFNGGGFWSPSPSHYTFDVSSLVQEVVNGPNWVSGSNVVFVVRPEVIQYVSFFADEHPTEAAASLEYTSSVNVNPQINELSVGTTINNQIQNITVVTQGVTGNVTSVVISKGSQSQAQTVTGSTTATQHQFDWVQGELGYGTGYTLTSTTDTGQVLTYSVNLSTASPYVIINDVSNLQDNSLLYNANPVAQVGDIIEWSSTSANGDTPSVNGRGEPRLTGVGTGTDTFTGRYWSSDTGVWSDQVFTITFTDPTDTGGGDTGGGDTGGGDTGGGTGGGAGGTGFASINSPSLSIVDNAKTISLYVNRDNTAEFQFLESGVAVDLAITTKIEFIVGSTTFSSLDHPDHFTILSGGKLEIEVGQLGLTVGTAQFYFVLYTQDQPNGIVWNKKEQFTLEMSLA